MKKEALVVTGGEGFVGHALIERLYRDTDYTIISLDCQLTGKSVKYIEDDRVIYIRTMLDHDRRYSTINYLTMLFEYYNIKCIFHFGEYSRVVPSLKNIHTVLESNVKLTISILELCKDFGVRLIYSASSTKFDTATINKSPYPFFKNQMVETIRRFGEWFDMNYNITYFYNIFGGGQVAFGEYATVIGIWNQQFMHGEPITVIGDGLQTRDFTYIGDIVEGLYRTFNQGIKQHEYHLGTGNEYQLLGLAKLYGTEIRFLPKIDCERQSGRAPVEDNLARTELGWKPTMFVDEYIKRFVAGHGSHSA